MQTSSPVYSSKATSAAQPSYRIEDKRPKLVNKTEPVATQKTSEALDLCKELGVLITNKREALGLTQDQMAKVFNYPPLVFAQIEAGTHKSLSFHDSIALIKTLQIRLDYFCDMLDTKVWSQNLSVAIEDEAAKVDQEMAYLKAEMEALQTKKNLMSRIRNSN